MQKGNRDKVPVGELLGRERELETISMAMADVEASKGTFVLITGESGIGKSVLARKMSEEAAKKGWAIMSGDCSYVSGGDPFLPIIQAIQHFKKGQKAKKGRPRRDSLPMNLTGLSGYRPGNGGAWGNLAPDSELTLERDRMFESVYRILEQTAKDRPVMLLLEDVHGAQDSTVKLLHYLARAVRRSKIMMLGTCQPLEPRSMRCQSSLIMMKQDLERNNAIVHVPLARLDHAASSKFLERLVAAKLSPSLVDKLHETAQGNPYFMEEFVNTLENQGIIEKGVGARSKVDIDQIKLPSTISEIVLGRLEGLDETERSLLDHASVVGQEVPYKLLMKATAMAEGPFSEAIQRFMDHRVIEEGLTGNDIIYRFKDKVVRKVLYDHLSNAKRKMIHKKVAAALEATAGKQGPDVYALAYHFYNAKDMPKALDYTLKAGEEAFDRLAFKEARDHLERALEIIEKSDNVEGMEDVNGKRVRVHLLIGRLDALLGEPDRAKRHFEDVICLSPGKSHDVAEAYISIGEIEIYRSKFKDAEPPLNLALKMAEAMGDAKATLHALIGLANVYMKMGDHDETIRLADRAMGMVWAAENRRELAQLFNVVSATWFFNKGDHKRTAECLQKARKMLDPKKDVHMYAKLLINEGVLNILDDQLDQAIAKFDEVLKFMEPIGDTVTTAYALFNTGEALVRLKRYDEADKYLDRALAIYEKFDLAEMVASCFTNKGELNANQKEWRSAEKYFQASMAIAKEKDLRWIKGQTHIALGRMFRMKGDFPGAREQYKMAETIYFSTGSKRFLDDVKREMETLATEEKDWKGGGGKDGKGK